MNKNLFFAIALLIVISTNAQESIAISGGDASGSGGSTSYSVGQLTYTTNTGTSGSVTQGVQQSFELITLSNPELTAVNLKAATYPNPTADYIMLNISDSRISNLSYKLYNVAGKLISNGMISNTETQIKMQNLDSAVYLLKVMQNNQELKTFKIIKK